MTKNNQNETSEKEGEVIDDILNEEEVGLAQVETKEVEEPELAKDETPSKQAEKTDSKVEDVQTEFKAKTEPIAEVQQIVSEAEKSNATEEETVVPPKPKRPLTPKQEAFRNLKDAFPIVEDKYIQGVLIAAKYNLESAFNALLYISDPESVNPEDLVPADQQVTVQTDYSGYVEEDRPSLPTRRSQPSDKPLTQIEQDELLAKRLNDEYNRRERRRDRQRNDPQRRNQGGDGRENPANDDDEDVFTNFVEKDLPQIKEQFTKNIEETKTKFNNWVGGWKKQYQSTSNNLNTRTQTNNQRRNNNNFEFDDDPEEVDLQKFHGISLNDSTTDNTKQSDFEDLDAKPQLPNRNRAGSTDIYGTPKSTKKWEPLKGTKPEPISKTTTTTTSTTTGLVDDDFLLSDDEDTVKK